MINKVPGTSTPFMRCGAAIADPTMPALECATVQDFVAMLEDFFVDKPDAPKQRIDDVILRFEASGKIYGGQFMAVLLHFMKSEGLLSEGNYDGWGISWFPTYADLLDLCRQFLASEAALAAKAA